MPFGNINTFYLPITANAGASLWGSNVRKLLSAADAASDALSKTNHSTGGAVVRTVSPYLTTTTDDVQANFGWAIDPTDMGSATGAKRFMRAGNHVATVRLGHNGATSDGSAALFCYVYRVGVSPTFTRTLLGSSSAVAALPTASGEVTATVTVALPEIIFEPGETVQYSFEMSAAGVAVVGRIVTFFTGTQTGVAARLVTPVLGVLADTSGSAAGLGSASASTGKVLAVAGSASGSGSGSAVGASTATMTGSASGLGSASAAVSSVAGSVGSAVGSGSASGLVSRVLGTTGTVVPASGGGGETTIVVKKVFVFDDE